MLWPLLLNYYVMLCTLHYFATVIGRVCYHSMETFIDDVRLQALLYLSVTNPGVMELGLKYPALSFLPNEARDDTVPPLIIFLHCTTAQGV